MVPLKALTFACVVLYHAQTEVKGRSFETKATRSRGRSVRAGSARRRSMGSAEIAGTQGRLHAARACAMARRPHIARGRSGACARRRARWRGAPFLPAARVPSSARACAHGAWRAGKEGDPPHYPRAFVLVDVRARVPT